MRHAEVVPFLLQLAALLGMASFLGLCLRRARLPGVIGEFLAGIVLGPTVLGALAPHWYQALFPVEGSTATARDAIARIGLLLFLFLAGQEIDLSHFRKRSGSVLGTSLCGMILPFALGAALVWLAPGMWEKSSGSATWPFALLIGTTLSISALPVIARILKDLNLLGSELGTVVIAAATADDLVGWTLFGLLLAPPVSGIADLLSLALRTGLVIVGLLGFGRLVGRPLFRRLRDRSPDPVTLLAAMSVIILLSASITEAVGLHAVLGAFLIGVALKETDGSLTQMRQTLTPPVLGILTPIYFASVGLKADFLRDFDPLLILVVTGVACLGKVTGGYIGARLGGQDSHMALAVGFGMNARGAMEIILATVALERGLIDSRVFVALVFMALFTSLVSGPAMRYLLAKRKSPDTKSLP